MEEFTNYLELVNKFVRKCSMKPNVLLLSNTNRVNMAIAFSLLYYKDYVINKIYKKNIDVNKQLSVVDDSSIDNNLSNALKQKRKVFLLTKSNKGVDGCMSINNFIEAIREDWNHYFGEKIGKFSVEKIFGFRWRNILNGLSELEFKDDFSINQSKIELSMFSSMKKNYNSFKNTFIDVRNRDYKINLLKQEGRLNEKLSMVEDALDNGRKILIGNKTVLLFNSQHRCRLWAVNKAKSKYDLVIAFSFTNKGLVRLLAASTSKEILNVFNNKVRTFVYNELGNSIASMTVEDFIKTFYRD